MNKHLFNNTKFTNKNKVLQMLPKCCKRRSNADDIKADNLVTSSIQQKDDTVLSNKTLSILPPSVKTPNYDRSHLKAGIIHIGIGN